MKILHTQENQPKPEDFSLTKDFKLSNSRKKAIKKRKRKSSDQLHLLFQEFKNSLEWDKETMSFLSKKTGLTEAQIYKWSWDQKKKLLNQDKLRTQKNIHLSEIFSGLPDLPALSGNRGEQSCIDTNGLGCFEVINLRSIDYEMYCIQKRYRVGMEGMMMSKHLEKGFDNFLDEISGLK